MATVTGRDVVPSGPSAGDVRTALDAAGLERAILDQLAYGQGRFPAIATPNDWYLAVAHAVRDRLLHRWVRTARSYAARGPKVVAYLSAEFLTGPHLGNALVNLGIEDAVRQAVTALGLDLDELLAREEEPGLGNGGLGRLAACFRLARDPRSAGDRLRHPLRVRHLRSGDP